LLKNKSIEFNCEVVNPSDSDTEGEDDENYLSNYRDFSSFNQICSFPECSIITAIQPCNQASSCCGFKFCTQHSLNGTNSHDCRAIRLQTHSTAVIMNVQDSLTTTSTAAVTSAQDLLTNATSLQNGLSVSICDDVSGKNEKRSFT
jgi:hypothetical protein